jgi:hypothetical protein
MRVITNPSQITAEWLTEVLQNKGHLPHGRVQQVTQQVSRPFGSLTVQLELSYSQDAPLAAPAHLFMKIDEGGLFEAGAREALFYEQLATVMPDAPVVPCYDVAHDADTGAYHLLMADASTTHYTVEREAPTRLAESRQIIEALARLHAYWWGRPLPVATGFIDSFTPLSLGPFADYMGDHLSAERLAIYERILARLPDLVNGRLAQTNSLTLVHDDAHPWNFLLPKQPAQHPVYLVDWQQWGVSIGAHDVAYLFTLFWYPERRARFEKSLVYYYHEQLVRLGISNYSWDDCWLDYRLYTVRNLLVPLWAWFRGHWAFHRWVQLEKGMAAFYDLNCAELL